MTLSELLEQKNITKTELAKILGVSRMTVQRMGEDIPSSVLAKLDEPPYTWLPVNPSHFDGHGRGQPITVEGQRVVLISKGWNKVEGGLDLDQGVVSEEDWKARLDYTCKHGREGWACKLCLEG